MNFRDREYDRDELLGFVVGVESQFYPQIGELSNVARYRTRAHLPRTGSTCRNS